MPTLSYRPWVLRPAAWAANLQGDVFGGVTAGVVALPLALAFGVASGLGPSAGVYGAIAVGVLAAAFGGTPAQVSGPTGPMTVVTAGIVATLAGDPGLVFAAVLLAGLIQIGFGLTRLGGYIQYVPYPVVSGFMTGIGVIIVGLQALPLLGRPVASTVVDSLRSVPDALADPHPVALGLGLAAVAVVYGSKWLTPRVPGALNALVLLTVTAWAFNLEAPTIGAIPTGLPSVALPPLDRVSFMAVLGPALTLAALGSIDSLLTSLVADAQTRTRHASNAELIGQGIGNAVSGLLGGLPGAGATMRTVANIQAGGRTPLSGVVHGLLLLAVLLGLAPLAAHIPLAVLAGILVTVGIGIVDVRGLRHFWRVPRADAAVMVSVLVLTVFVDLLQAVAVGMVMAALVFVRRMSDLDGMTPQPVRAFEPVQGDEPPLEVEDAVYVVPVRGPLFFGNALSLQAKLASLEDARAIALDLSDARFLDQSAAYALSDLAAEAHDRGVHLAICGLQEQPRRILLLTGVAPGDIPASALFPTLSHGLAAITRPLTDRALQ